MAERVPLSEVSCPIISALQLIDRYDVFLLDAYGVLIHSTDAMAGAAAFLHEITNQKKDVFVVTNDASRLPETCAKRFVEYGLPLAAEQIITSGALLKPHFSEEKLDGARTMVLGPPDSVEYVRQAGGEPIEPSADASFDVLVLCDDGGYPFLPMMDKILTNLFRHIDRGECPAMILTNPDLMYPISETAFGFTMGGAAMLLEAALHQRYPTMAPSFVRLGKPFAPMYREVHQRVATGSQMVMVGDQIETDIVGARTVGIDAALMETGIAKWDRLLVDPMYAPTYRLRGLCDV